jgi:hypothetical protein
MTQRKRIALVIDTEPPPVDPVKIDDRASRILELLDGLHGAEATLVVGTVLARICRAGHDGDPKTQRKLIEGAVRAGIAYDQADGGQVFEGFVS